LSRLDRQLPDLARAFDSQYVARLFQRHWRELEPDARSPIAVGGCKAQMVRYQPGRSCWVAYSLQVRERDREARQTIGVVEVTPKDLQPRLFSDDPHLPWLTAASDPAGMRARFAQLLEAQEGPTVAHLQTAPIRYHAGLRCTFRYDLSTSAGRRTFYGKVLNMHGERLMAAVEGLYQAALRSAQMPAIPRPLAYWPELHMLVLQAVPGNERLHDYVFSVSQHRADRLHLMHRAGVSLAALHTCQDISVPSQSFHGQLRALREDVPLVAVLDSALAHRLNRAVDELTTRAQGRCEPEPVLSHGAFRPGQLLVEDERLALIDLDRLCWANPARDVASFVADLDIKGLHRFQHSNAVASAGGLFLRGYREAGGQVDDDWLRLYRASSLLGTLRRRFLGLRFTKRPDEPRRLVDAAFALLER
jgi:aminoglycoside phosphotransferase (APT) family kinase protein